MSLGTNIKLFRIKRGFSSKEFAERIGVSSSMISKIEHDVTNPSLDVLRKIAMHLKVSVSDLVGGGANVTKHEQAPNNIRKFVLVRANERKLLKLPKSGIIYQLLTPDLQGKAEFVWVELEPNTGSSEFIFHEQGEEYALVLEGELCVYLEDTVHFLKKGDCIKFDATMPHRYQNEGSDKAIWVYLAIPPTL